MPPRFIVIFVVLAVVIWVVSIVDCAVQPATRHRALSKPVWIFIVVLLPVLGGILWFVIGRSRPSHGGMTQRAPDDDPEFLNSLNAVTSQSERIRRLEEELRALDDPKDEPDAEPTSDPRDDDSRDQHGAQS